MRRRGVRRKQGHPIAGRDAQTPETACQALDAPTELLVRGRRAVVPQRGARPEQADTARHEGERR